MNNQLGRLSFGQNQVIESEGTLFQQTLGAVSLEPVDEGSMWFLTDLIGNCSAGQIH